MNAKRTRIITLSIFIVLTLCVVLSRFYLNVQSEHWKSKSAAVETAYEKSLLTKATKVDFFYGDEPFQIVYGEDKLGQGVIVWVSDKEVHTEMTTEGFTEAQAREAVLKKDPAFEIERAMPGKLGQEYVWEVFYKKEDDSGTRYFYDYYKFKDGTYLDTYRLSLQ
ncbi:DUF5590 domain-containing protein [Paenibacillus sp. GCM10023248]|uniref:cell wall elongation regulator TseB-like domain-containing protein n=1 Tax=Bacillales TaxID=1385 RepID=UPI0023798651|nr:MULTISPECIES: DUF5590 domain-containing protein [Bacillales]MDD9267686.1 DUF5590 domain-containing protein [Paenibacillus sp. MAHUQ-63]MDR6884498.1 uncharacterized protein YpmB [Bacillus sp. 3255]